MHQLFVYEREILRQFLDGDLEEAMDLFLAEDAMVFPPDTEIVTGRDNQKEMSTAWLAMEGVELGWVESLVHQCQRQGVHLCWKQWGSYGPDGVYKGKGKTGCLVNCQVVQSVPHILMP